MISNKQTKSKQSIFLCREVEPEHLGREIYADNVETPYSCYLIRKLNLARDYQNLAEGETFFEAICASWEATSDFEELVIKKIYVYVETEIMFYSVLLGSFEPLTKNEKIKLKEWIASVSVEKVSKPLVRNAVPEKNNDELKAMMKQLMETSNEIFRLRKVINDLNDNMSVTKLETSSETAPVISRSIRTIHLKRAQPLLVNEEDSIEEINDNYDSQIELKRLKKAKEVVEVATEEVEQIAPPTVAPEMDVVGKKSKLEMAEKQVPVLENILNKEVLEVPDFDLKKELEKAEPSKTNQAETIQKEASPAWKIGFNISSKRKLLKKLVKSKIVASFDYKRLVIKKGNAKKVTPNDWAHFSLQMNARGKVSLSEEKTGFSKNELENLEDKIYAHFMNRRVRGMAKKNQPQKQSISRAELLDKIAQAEYLNYSWGQVLKQRKEDVLICDRLSSANLVATLDGFLQELRKVAYKRSLLGQKVRCSTEGLHKLEGYILMDKYMQRLSSTPNDFEERKGYF